MSKLGRSLALPVLLGLLIPAAGVLADDTDVYARPPSASAADNPNVVVLIDNSANWSSASQGWPATPPSYDSNGNMTDAGCPNPCKQGQAELRAMRVVAGEMGDNVNLGLMLFTEGAGANPAGGYVRFDVRPMNSTNKGAFQELLGYISSCPNSTNSLNGTPNCIVKNFDDPIEKVNSVNYSNGLFEVFKYFGGYTTPDLARADQSGGTQSASQFGPYRYAGNPDPKSDPYAYTPTTDPNRTTYDPPGVSSCAKNYLILIGNGFPGTDQSTVADLLSGVGGDISQLPLNNLSKTSESGLQTESLPNSTCGQYASAAACAAAATSQYTAQYPDGSNPVFSCALASSCSVGTPTYMVTSACNAYPNASDCTAALPGLFGGGLYGAPWSCALSASTCSVPVQLTAPNNVVDPYTPCLSLNTSTACTNYGNSHFPSYSSFNCTQEGNTGCGPGEKHYSITATTQFVPGQKFDQYGTLSTPGDVYTPSVTYTRTVTAYTPTGAFSQPTNANINYADEWARFLNRTDVSSQPGFQNVTTYVIDVFKDQPDEKQTQLLMGIARAGGGKYFAATNESEIKNALRRIMSEIQAVNSVFASSSLPVSVNTQGTYLNQVFMGMFRPNSDGTPRWAGNLKQYKFKIFSGVLRLADMNGIEAISSTTGFITPCAASYWSSDTGTYWDFPSSQAIGDCTAITSEFPTPGSPSFHSDLPDGEVVEKGGVAQHLRGVMSSGGVLTGSTQRYSTCPAGETPETWDCRKVLTCDGSSATSCINLTNFDTLNGDITATNLGLVVATEKNSLVDWVRGQDVDNENANFDASLLPITNEVRPSVHGGVVHAQPGVIDFGGSTGVVAFYGSDDGVFHAVSGNQGTSDGIELWSFIAPEHYGQLNRLRRNTPFVDFAGMAPPYAPKQYGFDGGMGIYQSAPTVWIFPSMRRGGRAIYGFDVSTPTVPVIKWRKGCFTSDTSNDTLCSAGYWSNIGQTWSKPNVTYLSGYVDGSGMRKPVLVFGGGYDLCEDTDSRTRCAGSGASKGDNIWFVDAGTGAIIRTYDTHFSVPGDLTLVTNDAGYVTHVYGADTGGYVYRINVGTWNGTSFGGSWSVDNSAVNVHAPNGIAIADLSETSARERKFLNGPAVVVRNNYHAVLIGSGDREHPLRSDYACLDGVGSVNNRFYMLIDMPLNGYLSPVPTNASLVDVTAGSATFDETTTPRPTITNVLNQSSTKGWYFDFGLCEQSVNKGLVIAGITYFGTNAPTASTSVCQINLGAARGYAVDFMTGNPMTPNVPRSAPYIGGGMPPSPVAGVVDVEGLKLPFCIGCIDPEAANASALEGSKIEINPVGSRFRPFWYIEHD